MSTAADVILSDDLQLALDSFAGWQRNEAYTNTIRTTVEHYSKRPVPLEDIERILERLKELKLIEHVLTLPLTGEKLWKRLV